MMPKADIDTELARLARHLQDLVDRLPRDEVLEAFTGAAKALAERVPPEHDAYMQERIHDMLAAAGVIPDDPATG